MSQFFYKDYKLSNKILRLQQMSKNSKAKKEEKRQQHTMYGNPIVVHYTNLVKKELDNLSRLLRTWNITNGGNHTPKSGSYLIRQYLEAQAEYYEKDQFKEGFFLIENFSNLAMIQDESIILKSFKLFPKTIWPMRYHTKFLSKLHSYTPEELIYILSHLYRLASGQFNNTWRIKPINAKTALMNRFFSVKLWRERNLFVHIGVEKIPVVKNGIIKRYEFVQFMYFLDILGDQFIENLAKLNQRMKHFTQTIFQDVSKKDHSQQLEVDRQHMKRAGKNHRFLFTENYNDYTERYEYYEFTLPQNLDDRAQQRYHPIHFKPYYVSAIENSTVIFDQNMKRWISKDYLSSIERKKIYQYQKQINEAMVKRFVDFQSAKSLVQLLTKIPNFKVNLTEQQKDVIGQNGNVLAVGRSGTGKTTCAVLRLFSIEMLYKIRFSLYKKKYQETIKDVRCGSEDLDNAVGLHCIFLTASPVLTYQIQRYYKKLTENIKSELQKKKKRVQSQKMKNQQGVVKQQVKVLDQSIEPEQLVNVPQTLTNRKSAEQIEEQKEMQEQFKDINLQEDIVNEQFKEEEDIDELKQKFQQTVDKFHSLHDLKETDYPGFFTVKSYIMMIDGVLAKPFFIRNKKASTTEDSKASWHNERKGVMMIENYFRGENEPNEQLDMDKIEEQINYSDEQQLQHQYLRQIQLRENKEKQQLTKKLQKSKTKNILSFEVDYEYFVTHFWPRVVKRYYSSRIITAHLVWTQIYSTIKGSAQAHQFPFQYLNQFTYVNQSSNNFLTKQEKLDIYETFCQYQRWKIRAGGYDIMDAVNYILNYIRYRSYEGPQIHYLMIDEVQDLPHAILYLLSKTATYGVFYSGDTAQTIAKGVGFRFCDLRSLFNPQVFNNSLALKPPIMKHLTVNFRSHNNILQLANSIVSCIEILFPKTIDRMKKQISDLQGPKPMILSSNDEDLLFYVLCGGQEQKQVEGDNMKKPPLQFGCNQVIIVRDQQSKNRVPSMLQHALCLTIYEAKGLEFNDVILFNFFVESPCPEKWNLLKSLNVITADIPKEEYEKNLSRHNERIQQRKNYKPEEKQEDIEDEEVNVEQSFNKETDSYRVKKVTSSLTRNFKDINDYAEFCSQLKLLYTAITRPKNTLIIYDDQPSVARASVEKIWERLGVIEIIDKEYILGELNKKSKQSEQVKIFKSIVTATDKSQWKQQGLKMYTRGYFDQAMKCFERSGNYDLYQKAQANKYADQATKKLIQIQSQRNMIKQGSFTYKEMSSNQLSKLKKRLKNDQAQSLKKFLIAASIFEQLCMFKQAGQCFFSGKSFEKAFQSFCKAFMHRQAAQSLEMQNKYRQAAQYYQKEGSYLKIIECLDMINQWSLILEYIHKFSKEMSEFEKQALLKKYSALALEELVYQIQFQNEPQEKKPENNRVQVIEEKDSDEEDEWDSSEDPELAAEREYQRKISAQLSNPSRKQSQVEQEKPQIDIKASVYQQLGTSKDQLQQQQKKQEDPSMSFSDLNDDDKQKSQNPINQEGVKSIDESFGDLNNSDQPQLLTSSKKEQDIQSIQSSFSDLNSKYIDQLQPDIESIRSLIDPEDVWVKNSISQIHKLHSQYSVIDDEESYNINVKIIKTKGNIFVQDDIMRRIVNIVSIINQSVHDFFKQFKGYQSLITTSNKQQEEADLRPEILQFEEIDPKFINIILDTLQSFKLFKLCLFVCNRYHMPAQAGRYLISLGMKYSTNAISNNSVNPILLAPSAFRKTQIEKGILASIALHAIYQNVNADFLKIKVTDNEESNRNSLGAYFIQGLILQGLYKKAVFMVNPQESLKILANFNDFGAYDSIFKQKLLKIENSPNVSFLQKVGNHQDAQYTQMILRKVIFDYCVLNKFDTISQRYYKQFETVTKTSSDYQKTLVVPTYLPFTKALLQGQGFLEQFKVLIQTGYKILTTGDSYKVQDLVYCLMILVHSQQHHLTLAQQLNNDAFLELYRCIMHIRLALRKLKGKNALRIIEAVMNIHQCYRIRYCKSMSFIDDTVCFVHRTSIITNQLVDNKTGNSIFAYFFEQDYNLILAKTSNIVKIILKKYETCLLKFFNRKLQKKNLASVYTFEEDRSFYEQIVIKKALNEDIIQLSGNKIKGTVKKQKKKTQGLKYNYDFMSRGRDHIISFVQESESEQQVFQAEEHFYHYSKNPKMQYLSAPLIKVFMKQSQNSKDIIEGRSLYGMGLNRIYREYVQKQGGFNLFDAIQFYKFKRVDLFVENILSVIDKLTLYSKHKFLVEALVLLLIQYKLIIEPKGFSLECSTSYLKYLENLEPIAHKKDQNVKVNSKEELHHLLNSKVELKLKYQNYYVSQMNRNQIVDIICDFLDVLHGQEYSKEEKFDQLILMYVINVAKEDKINQVLRTIIKRLGQAWKNSSLSSLVDTKSVGDYMNKRKQLMNSTYKSIHTQLHQIEVQNMGILSKAIEESEFDYQVETRMIKARTKAANTIGYWWKKKLLKIREKKIAFNNYFQYAVDTFNISSAKLTTLDDLRVMKLIHPDKKLYSQIDLLIQTEKAKTELLSFYLTNNISSSLDFHFILMSLNKIEECRKNYYLYIQQDEREIPQIDLDQIHVEMSELLETIEVWKKDQKWLREKNINLKRKKVFEVKWMTKSKGFSGVLKKRAGLKKQAILQGKKQYLKKLK